MGNTTSYVTEKDGKRDTLLLDSVVKEVSEVSSALRNTVEGIRHQQKQQTEDTTNAAKEMLDHMLMDVFGKLGDYFTTSASATCTESHEKGPDPRDSVYIIKKTQNDLLTKADLSEAEIKELIGTMTKLKERHISVDNVLAHFEEYGKRPSESNPSQPLSRGNSKKSSSFQPKQFSKEGKNHDRTERRANTIGAGNTAGTGDGAGNFEAGNCSVKERTGNRIVASVPGISEVRNKANPTIRDITENRSMKGQTVNANATSLTTNRTFAGKTSNPKLTGKARSNTFSDGNGKNTLNNLRGGQLENRSIKYEDDKLNVSYEFGDGAETDETSDGHLEVIKGNENESLQTNDQTTSDDSTEIERLMKTERLLTDEILCLKSTCTDHQNKLKLVTEENARLANDVTTKEQDIKSKQKEIMSLKQDNEKLVLRLSKLAGEKLTKDNPNITDLSDPNRPTKLGEIYSELYDNEWTDAYEGLTIEGYEETEAIKILNITLKNAYRFCAKNAADMLKKTEHVAVKLFEECNKSQISVCQSVAIPMSKPNDGTRQFSLSMLEEQFIERHWKPKIVPVRDQTGGRRAPNREKEVIKPAKMEGELVKLRKEVSLSMIPVVQQAYLRGKWDETCIEPLKPFIQKCLFLCWMMVVQSPPMVFDKNTEKGTRFESALYKQYTKSGDVFEYVVWPALLLHEDGPLVLKGVAQPKKAKE